MTKKIKFHHKVLTKGREIAIVFALILIISTFLPWGQTEVASVTGLKGDGQYVIGIGFLAFGLLFVKKFPKMIAYLLALALLALLRAELAPLAQRRELRDVVEAGRATSREVRGKRIGSKL